MKVRLIHKFAQALNDVDLSSFRAGEDIELPVRDAHILIAEGWARAVEPVTADTAGSELPSPTKRRE